MRQSGDAGLVVVAVSGAADSSTSPELRGEIDSALAGQGSRVIVDLSGATFLDSAMLGTLAAACGRANRPEGPPRIAIVCPRGDVRAMFEITALDTLLPLRETMDDARELVGEG
jgi:anti-anti-sigma factor